ncbi:MAG: hypothetical protein ING26_13290 [Roseomonas sp.]|nr:hypothetical protein [Roseomonas sp.]
MTFGELPPEEIERRRLASAAVMAAKDRAEWEAKYQETCDRLYWSRGQCCAGCDHWESSGALLGRCSAAGIMSSADVLRSMGVTFSSYMPEPGFPYTRAEHACGLFRDDFDWSTLDTRYLRRIGAMKGHSLRNKPERRGNV